MKTSSGLPRRPSLRLPDARYAGEGSFYITLCAWERRHVFGCVVDDGVELSPLGALVREEWQRTTVVRPGVELGEFVVMPNHMHALLSLPDDGGASVRTSLRPADASLSTLVAGFKAKVTSRARRELGWRTEVWQARFFDRIVRGETEYDAIAAYIRANPERWRSGVPRTPAPSWAGG